MPKTDRDIMNSLAEAGFAPNLALNFLLHKEAMWL